MKLERYQREAEEFLTRLQEESYLTGSGRKAESETAGLYEEHAGLFTRKAVTEISERMADTEEEGEHRRLQYLREFAVRGHMGRKARHQAEKTETREIQSEVELPAGERVSYRQAQARLRSTDNRSERQVLRERLRCIREERLNPLEEHAFEARLEEVGRLGYDSAAELYGEVRGLDLWALSEMGRAFLARTDGLYLRLLTEALASLGVSPEEAEDHDISHLFHRHGRTPLLPPGRMASLLKRTVLGLGIVLREQSNILLDLEARATKSPQPFCAPVRIPQEVHLVLLPQGGTVDYEGLLHELGHAQHLAHVREDAPFAYRFLGDAAVGEGFALLLQYLLTDRHWLPEYIEVTDPEGVGRRQLFRKLYMLRRAFAQLLYEQELYQKGPGRSSRALYPQILGAALHCRMGQDRYLEDVKPDLAVADFLRAALFEVEMRDFLRRRFGERWYQSPHAGTFLRDLWSLGQELRVEEILRDRMEGRVIDVQSLIHEVSEGLA